MREFKPREKGIIKAFGKDYKINLDDTTLSKVVLIDMPKFAKLQNDIEKLNQEFISESISETEYGDKLEEFVRQIEIKCVNICNKILGVKATKEIIEELENPTTVDYTDLVVLIAEELGELRNINNKKLMEASIKHD